MNPSNRVASLDTLFNEWRESYAPAQRKEFHEDGIVDDLIFQQEATRLLYVLLEPNSKGGRYDKNQGCDLRSYFREVELRKPVNINLACWTKALLDGVAEFDSSLSAAQATVQLKRVAIMNLKKLAGSGTANLVAVGVQAWSDRKFIRREIELIAPNIIVTCSQAANRLFGWIIADCPFQEVPEKAVWSYGAIKILPVNHPSLRPRNALDAFERLIERASNGAVGALGR